MKPKAIDVHTHVEFAGTFDILKKRYTDEEIFERFAVSATGRRSAELNRGIVAGIRDALRDPRKKIRDMDEAGIGFSVLSSTPFAFFYEVEDDLVVELARFQNDKLAEMVRMYPDRFAAMATLPLQVPGEALKELNRAAKELGLRGGRSAPGRLIRTQLRFNYAGRLPMYSTSDIFEPGSRGNLDLNGVVFPDMPWGLDAAGPVALLRNDMDARWPERAPARSRLYAFGYDAFAIVAELARRGTPFASPVPGVTGRLSLDPQRRVHRQLEFARIEEGRAEPLPAGASPGAGM